MLDLIFKAMRDGLLVTFTSPDDRAEISLYLTSNDGIYRATTRLDGQWTQDGDDVIDVLTYEYSTARFTKFVEDYFLPEA